jgi:glucan phosphoethanolaminetransferase (alkaline phosphatase superfamily)
VCAELRKVSKMSAKKLPAILAVCALCTLLMLPNVALLIVSWNMPTQPIAASVKTAILASLLLASFFAVFGRFLWFGCILLAPFAMLAPVEFFYIVRYGQASSAEILGTVAATSPAETIGYFGWLLLPLALCMLAAVSVALCASRWSRAAQLQWSGRLRDGVLVVTVFFPAAIFAAWALRLKGNLQTRIVGATNSVDILYDPFIAGYPFGIIRRIWIFEEEWHAMYATFSKLDAFRFHARQTGDIVKQRQIYVLVVGESSRRDRWQLFGYDRATNPELMHVHNLVPLPDVVTPWPASITAIPALLTRKPILDTGFAWNEASILRAMQEAGYETWWISNQLPMGRFDSPVATYALEAQHTIYLNHADWNAKNNFDEDLIAPLREVIANSTQRDKVFIVLHLMGSHEPYDLRYPSSFKHFTPTASDAGTEASSVDRINNSYDNTVLYTDHILAQVIDILRQNGSISALWFESDHGEALPTPTCKLEGHGNGTRYEYMIPALFWYSDAYDAQFPQRVSQLRANAAKPALSASTFESLVDMAGVDFQGHDPSWSLFSSQWHYRPRIVHSLWPTDFDHAHFSKACQMVFPPTNQ